MNAQIALELQPPMGVFQREFEDYLMTDIGRAALLFDLANPHVYVMFAGFARQAYGTGRERFGIAAIWERMRWEIAFTTREDAFKINNNHKAYYARKLMAENKDFEGLFCIRQ